MILLVASLCSLGFEQKRSDRFCLARLIQAPPTSFPRLCWFHSRCKSTALQIYINKVAKAARTSPPAGWEMSDNAKANKGANPRVNLTKVTPAEVRVAFGVLSIPGGKVNTRVVRIDHHSKVEEIFELYSTKDARGHQSLLGIQEEFRTRVGRNTTTTVREDAENIRTEGGANVSLNNAIRSRRTWVVRCPPSSP